MTASNPEEVLRAAGWSVAVHNDYSLAGTRYTFWLWTHPNGRWIKGEGRTDRDALQECLKSLMEPALAATSVKVQPVDGVEFDQPLSQPVPDRIWLLDLGGGDITWSGERDPDGEQVNAVEYVRARHSAPLVKEGERGNPDDSI